MSTLRKTKSLHLNMGTMNGIKATGKTSFSLILNNIFLGFTTIMHLLHFSSRLGPKSQSHYEAFIGMSPILTSKRSNPIMLMILKIIMQIIMDLMFSATIPISYQTIVLIATHVILKDFFYKCIILIRI
jgi:hypothetical protein